MGDKKQEAWFVRVRFLGYIPINAKGWMFAFVTFAIPICCLAYGKKFTEAHDMKMAGVFFAGFVIWILVSMIIMFRKSRKF